MIGHVAGTAGTVKVQTQEDFLSKKMSMIEDTKNVSDLELDMLNKVKARYERNGWNFAWDFETSKAKNTRKINF